MIIQVINCRVIKCHQTDTSNVGFHNVNNPLRITVIYLIDNWTFMWRLHIWCRTACRENRCWFCTTRCEHIKRLDTRCGELCMCVCFKFPLVCLWPELAKSVGIWQKYHKNKKADFLWNTVQVKTTRLTFHIAECWKVSEKEAYVESAS